MTDQIANDMTERDARAADSGANATRGFRAKERTAKTDPQRVSLLASEALGALHDVIFRNHVTYAEYDALKAWLIQVDQDGEWRALESRLAGATIGFRAGWSRRLRTYAQLLNRAAEQDQLAVLYHQRAVAAIDAGRFDTEIIRVTVPGCRGNPMSWSRVTGTRDPTPPSRTSPRRGRCGSASIRTRP